MPKPISPVVLAVVLADQAAGAMLRGMQASGSANSDEYGADYKPPMWLVIGGLSTVGVIVLAAVGATCYCERERVRECFSNLVSNVSDLWHRVTDSCRHSTNELAVPINDVRSADLVVSLPPAPASSV